MLCGLFEQFDDEKHWKKPVLASKSLSLLHKDAKVVLFHPDFNTPSCRAASLGWEKRLVHYCTIPLHPTMSTTRGNSASSKFEI